jgi:cytochrome c peroxidase
LFGNRNAPSIHYVKFNPDLYWNAEDETWMGGFFLDGRERTLIAQATGPLLNPVEMGNLDATQIRNKVRVASYAPLFKKIYGDDILDNVDLALDAVADAIVSYEQGPEFALFSSKYDYYLQGKVQLSTLEKKGLELFEAEDKGNCAACHPSQLGDNGESPLFTDFSYDNLGVGVNENLPFLVMNKSINPQGRQYRDPGLADNPLINNATDEKGKFKVPTLRNVELTGPYMHNGVFSSLREAVEFYNTRDIDDKWAAAETTDNVNADELGDLGLGDDDIDALVAFLKTLNDGYSTVK